MANFFNSVRITNFKSLKDVTLSDCKRINLLIGKPNVGKSNILEAIGMYSLPYIKYGECEKITQFVRLENIPELFFDGNINEKATVRINENTNTNSSCETIYRSGSIDFIVNQIDPIIDAKTHVSLYPAGAVNQRSIIEVDNLLDWTSSHTYSNDDADPQLPRVKFYKFHQPFRFKKQKFFISHLLPPYGTNLFDVIQVHKELKSDLSHLFSEYGLKLLFDNATHALRLMKPLEEDNIISFPYSSIADTIQRVIFFKAAIASNSDSILLFEEPEAHCFPPYITHIAREIIDSETNQFFIATHSPYILDTFLEKDRNDLAIYMTDFKEGQTVIKRLTDAEINEVYEYGLDLFFNAELFTDEI